MDGGEGGLPATPRFAARARRRARASRRKRSTTPRPSCTGCVRPRRPSSRCCRCVNVCGGGICRGCGLRTRCPRARPTRTASRRILRPSTPSTGEWACGGWFHDSLSLPYIHHTHPLPRSALRSFQPGGSTPSAAPGSPSSAAGAASGAGPLYDSRVALAFMRAYPELCAEADRLASKPFRTQASGRAGRVRRRKRPLTSPAAPCPPIVRLRCPATTLSARLRRASRRPGATRPSLRCSRRRTGSSCSCCARRRSGARRSAT